MNYDILSSQAHSFTFVDYGYAFPYAGDLTRDRYLGFGIGYKFKRGFKFQIQAIQQKIEGVTYIAEERRVYRPGGYMRFNNIAFKFGYAF